MGSQVPSGLNPKKFPLVLRSTTFEKNVSDFCLLNTEIIDKAGATFKEETETFCKVEIVLNQRLIEFLGMRQIGAGASLINFFSSYLCNKKYGTVGYTEYFDVSFLEPPRLHDVVLIETEIDDNGTNIANVKCDMKKIDKDVILVRGLQRRGV